MSSLIEGEAPKASGEAQDETKRVAAVAEFPVRSTAESRRDILTAMALAAAGFVLFALPSVQSRLFPPLDDPRMDFLVRFTRISQSVTGASAIFITTLYGCAAFGRVSGVLGGMMLASCGLLASFAQWGYTDVTLMFACGGTCCCTAWMLSVSRPGLVPAVLLGLFLGLSMLTKGLVGPVLLLLPLLGEAILRGRVNSKKLESFLVAFTIAMVMSACAAYAIEARQNGALANIFKDTFFTEGEPRNLLFYPTQFIIQMALWSPLLLPAWLIYAAIRRRARNEILDPAQHFALSNFRFLALYFVIGCIVFYVWPRQQIHYLLPVLPAMAMASGYILSNFSAPGGVIEEELAWSQLGLGAVGAVVIALTPVWPGAVLYEDLGPKLCWLISIPLAMGFVVLQFYCARQWVEGRALRAASTLAGVMFAILMYHAVNDARSNVSFPNPQISVVKVDASKSDDSAEKPEFAPLKSPGMPEK